VYRDSEREDYRAWIGPQVDTFRGPRCEGSL
jgi:hypothetical protein